MGFVFFCVQNTAANCGQYLALRNAWQNSIVSICIFSLYSGGLLSSGLLSGIHLGRPLFAGGSANFVFFRVPVTFLLHFFVYAWFYVNKFSNLLSEWV